MREGKGGEEWSQPSQCGSARKRSRGREGRREGGREGGREEKYPWATCTYWSESSLSLSPAVALSSAPSSRAPSPPSLPLPPSLQLSRTPTSPVSETSPLLAFSDESLHDCIGLCCSLWSCVGGVSTKYAFFGSSVAPDGGVLGPPLEFCLLVALPRVVF